MPNLDFTKLNNNLIPAVVQDAQTKQVLMLGFMNQEAYEKTLELGKATFWSRSKNRLWTKGEESGNFLEVVEIKPDCDNDAILIKAKPLGNTCHKGTYSCFSERLDRYKDSGPTAKILFLEKLQKIITKRKTSQDQNSYVYSLFQKGLDKIAQKVGEEATEVVIAGKNADKNELINEAADLVFHLLILLHAKNVSLTEVARELEKRSK